MPNAETAVSPLIAPGFAAMDLARGLTTKLAEGLTDDQLFTRACPNANHGAWVLGHIAATDEVFLTHLGGKPRVLPASWEGLFGMNSEVSDDRSRYPGLGELTEAVRDRRAALKSWLASLGEGDLLEPIGGDFAMFARDLAMAPSSIAFHEGFHAGQLSTARRAAGLAPLF